MNFVPRFRLSSPRAFSIQEMLVTIAVIGIMAAIAIPNIAGVLPGSENVVAQRNLNQLNAAYNGFAMANRSLSGSSSTTAQVLSYLKYRDTSIPGSPFIAQTMNLDTTSSTQTYRAYWNGEVFRMYAKGVSGTGVDLLKMSDNVAADSGAALPAP
jgi:prepilin-type N-terminal cleavage/methylation domain-containing protein